MPQLVIVATHSGKVVSLIACNNEAYAGELCEVLKQNTSLLCRAVPLNNSTEKLLRFVEN